MKSPSKRVRPWRYVVIGAAPPTKASHVSRVITRYSRCTGKIGSKLPKFDATANSNYFYVKNSWSTDWGEGGYVKIAANADNNG